jgi:non-canonical purine NTP pyrophosphatase (RdgB/HAM1 family)
VTRVVLASSNPGKLRELAALLAPLSLTLIPQGALGIAAVPETGATFLANALLKARHAAQCAQLPALADDSGLEVDALGGRPGVRSARFAGEGARGRVMTTICAGCSPSCATSPSRTARRAISASSSWCAARPMRGR